MRILSGKQMGYQAGYAQCCSQVISTLNKFTHLASEGEENMTEHIIHSWFVYVALQNIATVKRIIWERTNSRLFDVQAITLVGNHCLLWGSAHQQIPPYLPSAGVTHRNCCASLLVTRHRGSFLYGEHKVNY